MLDFWIAPASADCNLTTLYQSDKQKKQSTTRTKTNATDRKSAFTADYLTQNNKQ